MDDLEGRRVPTAVANRRERTLLLQSGSPTDGGGHHCKPHVRARRSEAPVRYTAPQPGDVTGDGKRFIYPTPEVLNAPSPFIVVTNWQAGLKK